MFWYSIYLWLSAQRPRHLTGWRLIGRGSLPIGNRHFSASRQHPGDVEKARKVILKFRDGEELWGTMEDLSDEGDGFFFYPTDKEDNNIRIFVIRSSLGGMEIVN